MGTNDATSEMRHVGRMADVSDSVPPQKVDVD